MIPDADTLPSSMRILFGDWGLVGVGIVAVIFLVMFQVVDAGALVPSSSVIVQQRQKQKQHQTQQQQSTRVAFSRPSFLHQALIPSQLLRSARGVELRGQQTSSTHQSSSEHVESTTTTTTTTTNTTTPLVHHHQRKGRRRPKKKKPKKKTIPERKQIDSDSAANNQLFPQQGNLPDIYWRSVRLSHLRQHPAFQALPAPHHITHLDCLEDVRNFRQDSWQWEVLHQGRCTTSQAVAALGFLEETVGQLLGVPPSWRSRGGRGAYTRLRHAPAVRTLEEMNAVLIQNEHNDNNNIDTTTSGTITRTRTSSSSSASDKEASDSSSSSKPTSRWLTPSASSDNSSTNSSSSSSEPFHVAQYNYQQPSQHELHDRREQAKRFGRDESLAKTIRMAWGNSQEATALLTALNYFSKEDPGLVLKEVGMCGAGLNLNQTVGVTGGEKQSLSSSLLVGATPDGILCYSDGRIEALEVKNHCPFYLSRTPSKRGRHVKGRKRFFLGDRSFDTDHSNGGGGGVFAHYIPQLQMEMLSLGPDCQSAVMVRQTATKGALVVRMHRDDAWIQEMLHFLHQFQSLYVEKGIPPPADFFWNNENHEERSRYRRFVSRTQELRNKVQVVAMIPSDDIQRAGGKAPLFLDG